MVDPFPDPDRHAAALGAIFVAREWQMTSAPEDGNAVGYFVDRHVIDGRGDDIAFRDAWRSLSYSALDGATRCFAGALRTAGVARERRVALLLFDTVDFPI